MFESDTVFLVTKLIHAGLHNNNHCIQSFQMDIMLCKSNVVQKERRFGTLLVFFTWISHSAKFAY